MICGMLGWEVSSTGNNAADKYLPSIEFSDRRPGGFTDDYQVAGNSAVHFFNLPCFVNCQSCLRMGLNMALYLKPEIRPQEHGIAIHDDGPIIWLKQVHATGNGIQQFEIEAIWGEKVDHSESYGMEERRKRTKKGSRCLPEA